MEQNQILGYLGGLFQKNAPITDEVFSALKGCLTPENLETRRDASGETKRIRAAIDSHGHFSSRHSKLTFKINEAGYANTILECSSRNGEGWHAYQIPTMLGVGAAYYALLAWEAYKGIEAGRLEAVGPEDDWSSYLEDYPEVENDERTEEECLTSALMLLAQNAEEVSDEDDEEGDE